MTAPSTTRSSWIEESDCSLDEFREQVSRDTHPADYPHAAGRFIPRCLR